MTEGRLFGIGLGLWVYQWLLYWYWKRSSKEETQPSASETALLHGFFYGLVGILLSVTIYAYMGHVRGFFKVGIMGGAIAFVFGFVAGLLKAKGFESKRDLLSIDLEWTQTASSAVILASVVMYVLIQAFKIPSGSMQPTLYEGDHLFVNKFYYGIRVPFTDKRVIRWHQVNPRDVTVFRYPAEDEKNQHYGKDFIKRAIAIGGDMVMVRDKKVYVNGSVVAAEPYTQFLDSRIFARFSEEMTAVSPEEYQRYWEKGELSQVLRGEEIRDNFGPVKVPQGHYFVLGDNRDASFDSRFWGPLPDKYLKGKAWFIYWPPKRIRVIH